MAGLCQSQLGLRHVHLPLVPRHSDFESEKQHVLHVRCDLSCFVLFYVMLIVIQLRRLGPLGLLPELFNTQQIERTLRSDSCALVYRLGTGLFWFIFMCDLFLLYIVLRWLVVVPQALFSPCYSFNISTTNYHWCL